MKKLIVSAMAMWFLLFCNVLWAKEPAPEGATNFKEVFSNGTVKGFYRAIYFDRDFDGPDSGKTKDRAVFANGGAVHLSTAPFNGLSGNFGFYTVQDFGLNDEDKNTEVRTLHHTDGKGLTSHQNTKGFSVLGEYFLQGKWGKTTARVGAMEIWGKWGTPWTHSWPFRVIPATYEGVYIQNQSIKDLKVYLTPYIWGFRENNKEDFISPAEHLTKDENEDGGISFIGLTYTGFDDLKLQGWYQYYHDVFDNTMFFADYMPKLTDDLTLILRGRLQYQSDVGDSLKGDHEALTYGVGMGIKAYGFTLEGRYQTVSDDGDLIEFHGASSYTSNMISSGGAIIKADLESYILKLGYDFGYFDPKFKGLSLGIDYSDHDYPDSGTLAEADMNELHFDAKYKFSGSLKGMSTRFRLTFYDQDIKQGGVGEATSFRFYLNYKF